MPWWGLCRATRLCAAAHVSAAPVLPLRSSATAAVVGMCPPPIPAGRWAPCRQHRVPVGVPLPSSQTHRSRHARPPPPPPPPMWRSPPRRRPARAVPVATPLGGGGEGVTGRQRVRRRLANLHPDEGQRRNGRCRSALARGCCGGSLPPNSGGGQSGGRPRGRRPFVDANRSTPGARHTPRIPPVWAETTVSQAHAVGAQQPRSQNARTGAHGQGHCSSGPPTPPPHLPPPHAYLPRNAAHTAAGSSSHWLSCRATRPSASK